jgi:hypothetical protein
MIATVVSKMVGRAAVVMWVMVRVDGGTVKLKQREEVLTCGV